MANVHAMSEAAEHVAAVLRELGAAGTPRRFDTEVPTAAAAAAVLGCDVGAIANSLVFAAGDTPVLVVTSGAHRVDTSLVAEQLGLPRLRRASPEFVLAATGQPVGGVAPVAHPEPVLTLVDRWLEKYDVVWAGAGDHLSMFPTSFEELLRLTGGRAADVGI
jgi:prolyl-tRNA editing enzyme YbaK/EbsC (Cys-tRNA(Pro) deacylase)